MVLPSGIVSTGAPAVIRVAERVGLGLDSWQQDVARVLFAKTADGGFAADTVAMSIPRQSGKTYLVSSLVFAMCLATPGITVAWTAHHNRVMLETFGSFRNTAQQPKLSPHIKATPSSAEYRAIEFTNGSRIVMAARESGALRGVAKVSVLVLDEAQILSEAAMSDIMPTQNQAEQPLTIMMGTPPRPKDRGDVFAQQRFDAIRAQNMGEALELAAWIEFAADSDADSDDRKQWAKANPSIPDRTPIRAIQKLRRTLTEDHFRREAMGIWDDNATPSVIPEPVWESLMDEGSLGVGRLALGIDVSPNRDTATVAVAGVRHDGLEHVEAVRHDFGLAWVVDEVANLVADNPIPYVVVDARSPASTLIGDLQRRGVTVIETDTKQLLEAVANFYDKSMQGLLRHIGQGLLTDALMQARKRAVGDRWAWNRLTPESDITPVVAATLALWGSGQAAGTETQQVRVML